ncbi:MAG: HAMP domain-containing histidine kinase [Muribaculaceae bacterium]|nr:HAMP domain-containing histidine kinase [Muribaculaceae bacterium]
MKKSLIWLLTAVMAITFASLLYFQITYLENIVSMRENQFTESVIRSLHSTVEELERTETLYYLENDVNALDTSLFSDKEGNSYPAYNMVDKETSSRSLSHLYTPTAGYNVSQRYRAMQESLRNNYLYQRGLLNEVVLNIMRTSSNRAINERADSTMVRQILTEKLASNGVTVPFVFSITTKENTTIYQTRGYISTGLEKYTTPLFPHTDNRYMLNVEFPTKNKYIFSSVRFIIPTLALTLMLLVIFVYTISVVFKQKKLTEMKADFINNMTHEFKTPISTISLAAQMLNDDSMLKSPTTLKHISRIINDESKRLRFQVEKVLQLSMFDNAGGSLNFTTVDVNEIINNIVNTHKLKVEKLGGDITVRLNAENSEVYVDEMHFTNVIFNLLDNAVKYMKKDTEPHLMVSTRNISGDKIEIRVRDNGIGIRKEDLKRIFDKFYRVSTGNLHDVKGFGLGLAYVKKMVTIFGGSIIVESDPGKWSEFIIELPIVSGSIQD